MYKKLALCSLLLGNIGCASKLVTSYTSLQGEVIKYRSIIPGESSSYIDSSRLLVYIKTEEFNFRVVLQNKSTSKPLYEIETYLAENLGKTVTMYGELISNKWNEFYTGIHMEVYAVEFYDPVSNENVLIDVKHGDRISDSAKDALRQFPSEGTKIIRKAVR